MHWHVSPLPATQCTALQHTATLSRVSPLTATHCNTLQHTMCFATHDCEHTRAKLLVLRHNTFSLLNSKTLFATHSRLYACPVPDSPCNTVLFFGQLKSPKDIGLHIKCYLWTCTFCFLCQLQYSSLVNLNLLLESEHLAHLTCLVSQCVFSQLVPSMFLNFFPGYFKSTLISWAHLPPLLTSLAQQTHEIPHTKTQPHKHTHTRQTTPATYPHTSTRVPLYLFGFLSVWIHNEKKSVLGLTILIWIYVCIHICTAFMSKIYVCIYVIHIYNIKVGLGLTLLICIACISVLHICTHMLHICTHILHICTHILHICTHISYIWTHKLHACSMYIHRTFHIYSSWCCVYYNRHNSTKRHMHKTFSNTPFRCPYPHKSGKWNESLQILD